MGSLGFCVIVEIPCDCLGFYVIVSDSLGLCVVLADSS